MLRLKNLGRVVIVIALFGGFWWVDSVKEQVKQLEGEISNQYFHANLLLRNTVEELLEWDFSQPLTDKYKDYLYRLLNEFDYKTNLIFSGNVVHHEWRSRTYDIESHVRNYINDSSLTKEDVADLHQALRATLYITMDFTDYNRFASNLYDATHDEKNEMVEQVKSLLEAQY